MSDYLTKYLIVHFVCTTIGLMTTLFTDRYLVVSNFIMATIFGPFYMIHEWLDLNAIVIDIRKK